MGCASNSLKFIVLLALSDVINSQLEGTDDKKVVLISPVLAAKRTSRVKAIETAKEFPLLLLLSDGKKDDKMEKKTGRLLHVKNLNSGVSYRSGRRRRMSRIYFVRRLNIN